MASVVLTASQTSCQAFADPYVEHDMLTLWLDLILLKRDVYRHLLYNRGLGARRLSETEPRRGSPSSLLSDSKERREVSESASPAVLLAQKIVSFFLHFHSINSKFTSGEVGTYPEARRCVYYR
jgi:hypothetical protein